MNFSLKVCQIRCNKKFLYQKQRNEFEKNYFKIQNKQININGGINSFINIKLIQHNAKGWSETGQAQDTNLAKHKRLKLNKTSENRKWA